MNRMFFRGLLILLLISIGISALLGVGAVLAGTFTDTVAKVMGTAITIGGASVACLAATVPLSRGRRKLLAGSALIASVWAALLIILTIWLWDPLRPMLDSIAPFNIVEEYLFKTLFTFTLIAIFLAVSSVLTMPRMKYSAATVVQYTTQVVMTLLLVSGLSALWGKVDYELVIRGISVLIILTAVGLVGTPMLALFLGTKTKEELTEVTTAVRLTCPRCLTAQDLPVGESRCQVCKLKFKIEVEEPRCPKCNYILRGLTRPICPECGQFLHPNELHANVAGPAPAETLVAAVPPPLIPVPSEAPPVVVPPRIEPPK